VGGEARGFEAGVRAGLAEGGEGGDDEGGLLGAERERVEAAGGEGAGAAVLDHDVGGEREGAELRIFHRDAALAREQRDLFVGVERARRPLAAHHVRAVAREPTRREGGGHAAADLEHTHAVEREHGGSVARDGGPVKKGTFLKL
jgi:hypothetical protein